jgi:hypothetical protein
VLSQSLFKIIFFSQPSFKKFYKSLYNPSLIGSKSQQPFISLLSVAIKIFLYQEWHLRLEPNLVSISLSFSLVYSIYPSAPPHVSRSQLHVKRCRCTYTYKPSLQSTNHTPFLSTFSSHSVLKKLHLLYLPVLSTPRPKIVASFLMI